MTFILLRKHLTTVQIHKDMLFGAKALLWRFLFCESCLWKMFSILAKIELFEKIQKVLFFLRVLLFRGD